MLPKFKRTPEFKLICHLVLVPIVAGSVFDPQIQESLHNYMRKVCALSDVDLLNSSGLPSEQNKQPYLVPGINTLLEELDPYKLYAQLALNKSTSSYTLDEVTAALEDAISRPAQGSSFIHLTISFPPKLKLSDLVGSLKTASARNLKRDYPTLLHILTEDGKLWAPSYLATTEQDPLLLKSQIEKFTGNKL